MSRNLLTALGPPNVPVRRELSARDATLIASSSRASQIEGLVSTRGRSDRLVPFSDSTRENLQFN